MSELTNLVQDSQNIQSYKKFLENSEKSINFEAKSGNLDNINIYSDSGETNLVVSVDQDGIKAKGFYDLSGYTFSSNSFWKGKRLLAIGDSITAAKRWQTTVGELLDMKVRNHCKGGTSSIQQIDGDGSEPPEHYDPDTDASGKLYPLNEADVTDVDLIIWHTFYNELQVDLGNITDMYSKGVTSGNTICGRINYGLKKIYNLLSSVNNMQCRVIMVTPYCVGNYPWTDYNGYDIRGNGVTVKELDEKIVECANNNGVPCLNLWTDLGANKYTWNYYGSSSTVYNNDYIPADGINDGTNKPFNNKDEFPSASENNGKYVSLGNQAYKSDGAEWTATSYPPYPWHGDQLHCSINGYTRMGHVIASFVNIL